MVFVDCIVRGDKIGSNSSKNGNAASKSEHCNQRSTFGATRQQFLLVQTTPTRLDSPPFHSLYGMYVCN